MSNQSKIWQIFVKIVYLKALSEDSDCAFWLDGSNFAFNTDDFDAIFDVTFIDTNCG